MQKNKNDFLLSEFTNDYELSIGLISSCNLDCKYCYGKNKNGDKLDLKILENTLKRLEDKNINVQFVGDGEALVDFEYFKKAVKIIKRFTYKIWLVTNGTLLSKEIIDFLILEKINITISMDGGTEQFQNKYRILKNGNGTYKKIKSNFNMLIK